MDADLPDLKGVSTPLDKQASPKCKGDWGARHLLFSCTLQTVVSFKLTFFSKVSQARSTTTVTQSSKATPSGALPSLPPPPPRTRLPTFRGRPLFPFSFPRKTRLKIGQRKDVSVASELHYGMVSGGFFRVARWFSCCTPYL